MASIAPWTKMDLAGMNYRMTINVKTFPNGTRVEQEAIWEKMAQDCFVEH